MRVKIDRDVPPPQRAVIASYDMPFGSMRAGDSFWVPFPSPRISNLISARQSRGRYKNKKFATASESKNGVPGCRVWRVK